jgi:hypothetical protein
MKIKSFIFETEPFEIPFERINGRRIRWIPFQVDSQPHGWRVWARLEDDWGPDPNWDADYLGYA